MEVPGNAACRRPRRAYDAGMTTIALLIAAGLILLALETILPGLIAGILGLASLAAAVVYAYSELGVRAGNYTLAIVSAALALGSLLWLKFFPGSRFAQRFVSQSIIGNVGAEQPQLLHRSGQALTALRPAGTALIDGKRCDVVTEGGFIEKGQPVQVVAIEGLRVVVRLKAA